MITCREASQMISEGMDRTLSFGQRVRLALHLMICTGCSRVKQQFAILRQMAASYPVTDEGDEPPPQP
jgi:hypothetical protein